MFLPLDSVAATDYPAHSAIAENDWHILAGFWHPVAYCHEIGEAPYPVRLLDVDLVVVRNQTGLSVFKDQCPHRGARLSQGESQSGLLVCPMHGLGFNDLGECVRIPCLGPNAKFSPRRNLTRYLAAEKYGLLWVCLKPEPRQPLVDWPELAQPQREPVYIASGRWQASAARHVENFNDVAHFPFVHTQTFGGEEDDPLPEYDVERTATGLAFQLPYRERVRMTAQGEPVSADYALGQMQTRNVVYYYQLTLPFSSYIRVECEDYPFINDIYDTVCPISAYECQIFQIVTDSMGIENAEFWQSDTQKINEEDAPLVENQRPKALPLNLLDEVHLPCDRFSVAYRRVLAEMGLGRAVNQSAGVN
ncbi:aromatic ring-hydroxylating dioxygenase subunit alpha [Halioxenophilus sp. WMMB6]|uniref:aromatic ring-hydroxylating dioxygenase subunit alpha n=1 Tax=Halioxenophilus sp. WMMB6 TaxID=3073815 RepID=UPI00295E36C5|nr:aromatic ring-hydroxylating dioxygenase subunit alpha [Halioxenophilus sp. WMMB6]